MSSQVQLPVGWHANLELCPSTMDPNSQTRPQTQSSGIHASLGPYPSACLDASTYVGPQAWSTSTAHQYGPSPCVYPPLGLKHVHESPGLLQQVPE